MKASEMPRYQMVLVMPHEKTPCATPTTYVKIGDADTPYPTTLFLKHTAYLKLERYMKQPEDGDGLAISDEAYDDGVAAGYYVPVSGLAEARQKCAEHGCRLEGYEEVNEWWKFLDKEQQERYIDDILEHC